MYYCVDILLVVELSRSGVTDRWCYSLVFRLEPTEAHSDAT